MVVTKPEFIQEAETAYSQTTPKETPSFSVKKGDLLLAVMSCEEVSGGAGQLTISGGGFTWKLLDRVTVNQYTEVGIWKADATEDKTFKCTIARGATARSFGGNVLTFRKSSGVGTAVKTNVSNGAPTLNVTTTNEHSAIVVGVGDWNAIDGKSRAWRTNAGALTEQTYNFLNGVYTSYAGFHADAGATGVYAVGLSVPTGQKYSIVAVEVFGETEAGGKSLTLELTDAASFSESRGGAPAAAQSDTVALTEALGRSSGLSRADAVAIAEAMGRLSNLGQGDQVALVDTLAVAFGLSPADAIAVADAIANRLTLSPSEQLAVEGLLTRSWQAQLDLDDTAAVADAQVRTSAKQLLEGAMLGDITQLDIDAYSADELGLLDVLELALRWVLEDGIGLSESVARTFGLSLSDSLALLDEVEGTGTAATALHDALGLGEQYRLVVGRLEGESVAFGDSLAKTLAHQEGDAITFSESIGKRISSSISDALSTVDALARQAFTFIVDLFGLSEASEVEGGQQADVPAHLALTASPVTALALDDRAATALAVVDEPATALTLAHQPTTYLALEDEPHV